MPNIVSLTYFFPEIALSVTVIVLLIGACVTASSRGQTPAYIAAIGLVIALVLVYQQWGIGNPPLFWGLLTLDKPAEFFKVIFIVTALITVVFSQYSRELRSCHCAFGLAMTTSNACPPKLEERRREPRLPAPYNGRRPSSGPASARGGSPPNRQRTGAFGGSASVAGATNDSFEYYSLLTASVLGMCLLAQATNLLMIYLALEFVSLTSYLLVGYVRGSARSSEAALKYVLFGAVASGVFLYGASMFYGITGSLDITGYWLLVTGYPSSPLSPFTFHLSAIFILAGFFYKIAAVPMHAWCPDAYEGAPTPITAFLSVAPKAAGFAVLMRILANTFTDAATFIAIISAVTMTFGNLAAIPQTNLKRLLAYSSIAHAGYILMGLAAGTSQGTQAVLFYFVAYLLMNLGAFLVVHIISNQLGVEDIAGYEGLGKKSAYGAILGITMTIFLLSLTGVPPFVGFIGKFYLFAAVIDAKLYWLAVVGIINSVISLYYYMRIVKAIFFGTSKEGAAPQPAVLQHSILLIALAAATIGLGIGWSGLARIISAI